MAPATSSECSKCGSASSSGQALSACGTSFELGGTLVLAGPTQVIGGATEILDPDITPAPADKHPADRPPAGLRQRSTRISRAAQSLASAMRFSASSGKAAWAPCISPETRNRSRGRPQSDPAGVCQQSRDRADVQQELILAPPGHAPERHPHLRSGARGWTALYYDAVRRGRTLKSTSWSGAGSRRKIPPQS